MDTKQKYVRVKKYDSIIIFPQIIEHSTFSHLEPVSAGFCIIDSDKKQVDCFGASHSLMVKSDKDDSELATRQIFGMEAVYMM